MFVFFRVIEKCLWLVGIGRIRTFVRRIQVMSTRDRPIELLLKIVYSSRARDAVESGCNISRVYLFISPPPPITFHHSTDNYSLYAPSVRFR